MKLPRNIFDRAASEGCVSRLVGLSSFCGVKDARKLVGKSRAHWCLCLIHVTLSIILAQVGRATDGIIQCLPISKVALAHGCLGDDVGQGHIEYGPRLLGSMVGRGRSLDATAVSRDDAPELSPSDLGLPIKDGLLGAGVSVLGQVMSEEKTDATGADGGKDSYKDGVHSVFEKMMIGWIIGTGLVVAAALAFRGYFLPNVQCPPTGAQEKEVGK